MAKKVTLKYNDQEYLFDLQKGSEDEIASIMPGYTELLLILDIH